MTDSPNLDITFLEQNQAQKHVTVNEAIRTLDAVVQLSVADRSLTTPPGSPADGDRYIVAGTATGAWVGSEDLIAAYQDGAWAFYTPQEGWLCYVQDEGLYVKYDNGWIVSDAGQVQTANETATELRLVEENVAGLSGATGTTTLAFPAGCIILGVTVYVRTAITGATSFDIGDGTDVDRFGAAIDISAGTDHIGSITPVLNPAAFQVVLTANGSNFTAGAVRVALHYIRLTPPTA